ncbi:MAG: hypothetical protein J5I98_05500 [Phaeodactylibacter sp.]|nr:hypothetical protein [Phaeodactylibacter sp.]
MQSFKSWFWLLLFACLFLLTQDYLFIRWQPKPTLLGFPSWLLWFAALHLAFVMAFYYFSRRYWKE